MPTNRQLWIYLVESVSSFRVEIPPQFLKHSWQSKGTRDPMPPETPQEIAGLIKGPLTIGFPLIRPAIRAGYFLGETWHWGVPLGSHETCHLYSFVILVVNHPGGSRCSKSREFQGTPQACGTPHSRIPWFVWEIFLGPADMGPGIPMVSS